MAKKPTITTIDSGYYGRQALNDNFTAIRDAFDNTVSRDGSTPNTMTADLDMNSNGILNVDRINNVPFTGALPDLGNAIAAAEAAQAGAETAETGAVAAQTAAESAETTASAAATTASSAATTATTASTAAQAAQSAAETAQTAAETARDAAFVNADVYADTAAGLAGTSIGDQFQVVVGSEIIRYRHDSGPVATEVARYPSADQVSVDYDAALFASREEWLTRSRLQNTTKPKAAVVVLLGQSNNAARGTSISGTVSRDAYMPVNGNAIQYFDFYAGNAEHTTHWDDIATAVQHQEGASESPCSGTAIGVLGGHYERAYVCSVAIGARALEVLNQGGPANNKFAVITRLCDLARSAGYDPEVMFTVHHGESDAFLGTSEADYYSLGMDYYNQARAHAALAMEKPEYDAPFVFHMPTAYGSFGSAPNMKAVAKAIVRMANDLPNAMLAGGSYQFPTESDRVHQTEEGYRIRGEHAGYLLRQFAESKGRHKSLHIVEANWSGTTCNVLFNKEIVRDTGVDYGTNLNTSFALAGLEFLDDGSYIQITNISVQGRTAVLTLASTPSGTTQEVQIASQTITGTLTAGSNNLPGSQIRSTETQRLSIYDYTFDIGDFAAPQIIEATP